MRHGDKINNLGRKKEHRMALLRNLSVSLIEHKRIVTTLAKAKALRVFVEPLFTKSKVNTTHSRRVVFSYLQNKYAVQELFDNIAGKIGQRPGGYTRILRVGTRYGDNAQLAMIELVDYNSIYHPKKQIEQAPQVTEGHTGQSGAPRKSKTRRAKKKSAPVKEQIPAAEQANLSDEPAV